MNSYMTLEERQDLIKTIKEERQVIYGQYINLHPYALEHSEMIVKLRNQEKSRYNLNQHEESNLYKQNEWYRDYSLRNDDLYWCIYNKAEIIIGVIRLYNINHNECHCNQGSFIIDETYAMGGPYALETEIITLNFAFDTLQIDTIFNDIRVENKVMNSISRRIGFRFVKEFEREGVYFNLYELTKRNYNRNELEMILNKWKKRE